MNRAVVASLIVSISVLGLAGCVSAPPTGGMGGGDYTKKQVRQSARVDIGVIESIRFVRIAAEKSRHGSTVAPVIGAVAGGALGSQIGNGSGRKVAIVLGALAGGAAGSAVANSNNTLSGIELIVSTDRGTVAVTQAAEGIDFRPGDPVHLLKSNDGTLRVVPI